MELPEKIRRTLEKIVREMRIQENIYGVGLFGSRSRGDAAESSDIDLLILDKGNFNHEFVEKIEINGLLIDLDHIPKRALVDDASAEDKLKLFKVIWDETSFTAKQNLQAFESSHFKNKTKLRFYLNPAFLQGMVARTKSLINSGKAIEATHYLNDVLVDLIENYAWLKSSVDKVKIDYTTLMRSLKGLEKKNPKNYEHMRVAKPKRCRQDQSS